MNVHDTEDWNTAYNFSRVWFTQEVDYKMRDWVFASCQNTSE